MKTEIYNLIILDESGSMTGLSHATITGCNETLNAIRSTQKQFAQTQDHYVSIYVFQSDSDVPSRYLVKNVPIAMVNDINQKLYKPWGCTPLLDAVGSTLVDLKAVTKDKKLAIGNVTIITDGMENSSKHYTWEKVAKLINQLKELGWSFNFIGANIDVNATAKSLNIDNALEFKQDLKGTQEMFRTERESRWKWACRANAVMADIEAEEASSPCVDEKGRLEKMKDRLKNAAKGYFNSDDSEV